MQNFKLIFKFSLKRILKSKTFKIFFLICLVFNFCLNLLFFGLLPNEMMISFAMLFTSIIGIFFISFIDINNIVTFIIQDDSSGIQGLQIRRGSTITNIYFAKLLANKLITITYILITYLFFILAISFYNFGAKSFVLSSFSLGVFALIPFDLFITAIALVLSVLFKKYKISLSICWITYTLLTFYWLFGPILFAFVPINTKELKDVSRYNANEIYKLSNTYENGVTQNLVDSYNNFSDITAMAKDNLNVTFFNEQTVGQEISENDVKSYFWSMITDGGLILEFYNLLEIDDQFNNWVKNYLNYLNIENIIEITLDNEESIKTQLDDNFFFIFIKTIAEEDKDNNNLETYKNSYFYKVSKRNYTKENQLESVINNINSEVISSLEIEIYPEELEKFRNIINDQFIYYYSWSEYKKINIKNTYNDETIQKINEKYSMDTNPEFWVGNTYYTHGTRFIQIILNELIGIVNYPSLSGDIESYEKYENYIKANYSFNPFMSLYNMFYFSGKNDFLNDNIVLNQFLLPIGDFRVVLESDNNEELFKFETRPFNIVLTYFSWILISIFLIGLSYFIFQKVIYKRAGE